jgi:DNA-binding NarL/FixJ family response regulator
MIRVVLADDHALVRAGIRSLLQLIDRVQVVAEADDGAAALALVETHRPDLVLMDIAMSGMNGLEATTEIKRLYPDVNVIILSMYVNEAYVEEALRAGASGYLLKDAETAEIELALNAAARGDMHLGPRVSKQLVESYLRRDGAGRRAVTSNLGAEIRLTARQREILQCIAEGRSTKEIAHHLKISPKTVEAHRTHLMERLAIRDVPGLVRYAIRIGLVALDK